MNPIEGPKTPFEVYCHHCQTSFAAGTRTCIHCGNRIGKMHRVPAGEVVPDVIHPAEEEEGAELSLGRRMGGLAVWVVIAVGATLLRLCEG